MPYSAGKFTNWARNHQCCPEAYFEPASEEEVVEIVRKAASETKQVKVVGAGHSWSPIAMTDGYLLNLDRLNKVINIDTGQKQVTVQAGIRLKDLNQVLYDNGLAMANLGSISEQSIAGAISTGTHGTGIRFGNLATQVMGMKLILADGTVLKLSADENPEVFSAARVGLGCLGIISEVTLQCVEAFNLKEEAFPIRFEEALRNIPQYIEQYDHVKFWWFPHAPFVQLYSYTRTTEPVQPLSRVGRFMEESFLAEYTFKTLLNLGQVSSRAVPYLNRVVKTLYFKKKGRIEPSPRVFNVPMPPIHNESEYAIPMEHTAEAFSRLNDMIEAQRHRVNFIVELRFVKGDDIPLSPCYGRDTCYIGAYLYGLRGWERYLRSFEELMAEYDGRPHWGKEFNIGAEKFERLYPKYREFAAIRNQLDPQGMFRNKLIDRIFDK